MAYTFFNAAVAKIGAAQDGHTMALMPLIGAGAASLILRKPLHAYHLWGMMLIVFGIALGAKTPRGRATSGADGGG